MPGPSLYQVIAAASAEIATLPHDLLLAKDHPLEDIVDPAGLSAHRRLRIVSALAALRGAFAAALSRGQILDFAFSHRDDGDCDIFFGTETIVVILRGARGSAPVLDRLEHDLALAHAADAGLEGTYSVTFRDGDRDMEAAIRSGSPRQAALIVAALLAAGNPDRTQAEVFEEDPPRHPHPRPEASWRAPMTETSLRGVIADLCLVIATLPDGIWFDRDRPVEDILDAGRVSAHRRLALLPRIAELRDRLADLLPQGQDFAFSLSGRKGQDCALHFAVELDPDRA